MSSWTHAEALRRDAVSGTIGDIIATRYLVDGQRFLHSGRGFDTFEAHLGRLRVVNCKA